MQARIRFSTHLFRESVTPSQPNDQRLLALGGSRDLRNPTLLFLPLALSTKQECPAGRLGCCDHLFIWGCSLFHTISNASDLNSQEKLGNRCPNLLVLRFHLFRDHSHTVAQYCVTLDYVGIVILMWAAGIPTIYYGFICNPELQLLYWMTVSDEKPRSSAISDALPDQFYGHVLYHLLTRYSSRAIEIQILARKLVHLLRTELSRVYDPRTRYPWLGDAKGTHVVGVDRLDGCCQSSRRYSLHG